MSKRRTEIWLTLIVLAVACYLRRFSGYLRT